MLDLLAHRHWHVVQYELPDTQNALAGVRGRTADRAEAILAALGPEVDDVECRGLYEDLGLVLEAPSSRPGLPEDGFVGVEGLVALMRQEQEQKMRLRKYSERGEGGRGEEERGRREAGAGKDEAGSVKGWGEMLGFSKSRR